MKCGHEIVLVPLCADQGLDMSLLPIRLKLMDGDLEQSIYSYRRLANDQYEDAVKHLRLSLYSTPPLLPSLLPLIQVFLSII